MLVKQIKQSKTWTKSGGMVNQFFMNTSAPYSTTNRLGEGQGRLPGQAKYDVQVGGYSN